MPYHTIELFQLISLPVGRFGLFDIIGTFPGVPIGTISSHFAPYARESPFDWTCPLLLGDNGRCTLVCKYFMLRLEHGCQGPGRLECWSKARRELRSWGTHQKHLAHWPSWGDREQSHKLAWHTAAFSERRAPSHSAQDIVSSWCSNVSVSQEEIPI